MTDEALQGWRPLHLLSQQRLNAIAAQVHEALPEIVQAWWPTSCQIQLVAVSSWENAAQDLQFSPPRYLVRDAQLWLAILGNEAAWSKLAEGWLECDVPMAGPLVQTLQRQFCVDLFGRLTGRGTTALVFDDGNAHQVPPHALRAGAGTTVIELDINGVPLILVSPIELWSSMTQWPEQPHSRPLEQMAQALGDTRVCLDVRLPPVRVAMADLASLAPGDFLDLQQDLSGRVRLANRGIGVTLHGVLGQHAGQKAIRLDNNDGAGT